MYVRVPGSSWIVVLSSLAGTVGVGVLEKSAKARARSQLGDSVMKTPAAGFAGLDARGVWLMRGERVVCVDTLATSRERLGEQEAEGPPDGLALSVDRDDWLRRGTELLERLEGSSLGGAKQALFARIAREDVRLTRRVKAVIGDLELGRDAEVLAEGARVFVAEAARAPRGTKALLSVDWSSGEPVTRELRLDPAKRPKDQLDALFARARRLKRGAIVATARLEEARVKRARLATLREQASLATTPDDLAAACERSHREDPALLPGLARAPRPESSSQGRRTAPTRVPFRTFVTTTGARILVGRGATDNDELTLRVARPHDLWLHVKGEAGAHVVVPLTKGHEATAELLVDAAHLAAHFSDARQEAVVDVTYVSRRYVRKRRGAPPGQVQVDREKVLVLRVDSARLAALLAREDAIA